MVLLVGEHWLETEETFFFVESTRIVDSPSHLLSSSVATGSRSMNSPTMFFPFFFFLVFHPPFLPLPARTLLTSLGHIFIFFIFLPPFSCLCVCALPALPNNKKGRRRGFFYLLFVSFLLVYHQFHR